MNSPSSDDPHAGLQPGHGGRPVPLSTTFTAVVHGSDGTTHLESVEAVLFHTILHVSGDIVNQPGPAGFDIALKAAAEHGRIQDATGPGDGYVSAALHRRRVADVDGARAITGPPRPDPDRGTIHTGSDAIHRRPRRRKAGGAESPRARPGRRRADGPGGEQRRRQLRLASGRVSLPDLTFDVPGATVTLAGTYRTSTQQMDFDGQLQMEASLSDAVGGFKSIFIKPFDFIFRRDGYGSVIPIRIEGTRDHPKVSVRIGAALTRGK